MEKGIQVKDENGNIVLEASNGELKVNGEIKNSKSAIEMNTKHKIAIEIKALVDVLPNCREVDPITYKEIINCIMDLQKIYNNIN